MQCVVIDSKLYDNSCRNNKKYMVDKSVGIIWKFTIDYNTILIIKRRQSEPINFTIIYISWMWACICDIFYYHQTLLIAC